MKWWQWVYVYVMLVLRIPIKKEHLGAHERWSPKRDYDKYNDNGLWGPVEMLSPAEQVVVVHNMFAHTDAALIEFAAVMDSIMMELCKSDPETWAKLKRWNQTSMEETGSFDRAELERMLDERTPDDTSVPMLGML